MIFPPNSFNSMLETEANILGTWCTICGTANSLTILSYLGVFEGWWEFVTSLGSRCLCNSLGLRADCYFLVQQLGMQHFCVMDNTVKYLDYNVQSCLCDFRTQVLFLDVACVPGGTPTKGPGPLFLPVLKMQILRTPAIMLLSCSSTDDLWLFCLLQISSLITICF